MTAPEGAAGVAALSARERATLRLLLAGHDAKSIARELDLSVHTVNERLREARRKTGVSSSRAAARLLAAAEGDDFAVPDISGPDIPAPDIPVPALLGDAPAPRRPREASPSNPAGRGGRALLWFGGGMLMMSLLIVALVILPGAGGVPAGAAPDQTPAAPTAPAETSPGVAEARTWVALIDRRQWAESWQAASTSFRQTVTAAAWTATVRPLRERLGAVASRRLQDAQRTTTLPGMPDGDYAIIAFRTAFANKADAVETVILARDAGAWTVAGYFIR